MIKWTGTITEYNESGTLIQEYLFNNRKEQKVIEKSIKQKEWYSYNVNKVLSIF